MAERSDRPDLSLDKPSEQGFITFFKGLPEKSETTVRLFERNDYYSVHGEDALFVAQTVYKTSTVIKYLGDERKGLPSCTLSKLNTISFLRDMLLHKLYRIEIWSSEGRKGSQWQITKRASPGNLVDVEDMLFTASDVSTSPVVLALKLETKGDQRLVGAAYTDATTQRLIGVAEFIDNDTFSNFESLLIQLSVKECVLPEDSQNYELRKIEGILDRCGIVVTSRKKGDFQSKDIEQDLARLLDEDMAISALPEMELTVAMGCVACLIKYLGLLSVETNFHQYTLRLYDLSQYMKLDAAAVRALNLMPGPQDGSNKSMSLYGLLNKCKTAQGSRLLAQWLKQPLMSLPEIQTRQDLVEVFINDTSIRQQLQEENLRNFPDLHRLAKRFQRQNAHLQDVVRVYQVLIKLPALRDALQRYTGDHEQLIEETFVSKLNEYMEHLKNLEELVETTIDLAAIEHHDFRIKADFDQTLQEVRAQMDTTFERLEPEAMKAADDLDIEYEKKLKFEKNAQYGHIMRLSRKDAAIIRNKREYIELATRKDGVYFTTSTLRRLSEEYAQLSAEYESTQSKLVKEVIEITGSYFPVLELLNQSIAVLDVLVSFAHVAIHAPVPYVRPVLTKKGEGDVHLKAARHPCLEMQDVAFIDNDTEMLRESSSFHIITGPNMGGKSTYIRQIGMIALMGQVGCFVPCRAANLCIFDSILARVGAGDSTLKGVSTFMAEMLETSAILKAATPDSLIIIDELGRGTSTYDGFGLAWAISEYIATNLQSFTLFATHFHELTALYEKVPTVRNLHVAALREERGITLLYKVRDGACDQSFGIHVAELASFPDSVVKMAKRKAAELEDFETNGDVITKRAWKSSEQEIQDGEALIDRFLDEFAKVPLDSDSAIQGLQRIRESFATDIDNSPFVKEILTDL
ncbi:muts domain V-domain-containing protein [Fimicolochytrium jonesii]|uniref:muts domain V-domain-containing protein n=1 Tax=Fimicolochytrium jonesii TaxID=1396493 RepID=UPI0022FF3A0D|nr:muts domain V-domain-containing protein [Fimicolochytrium jonesii]KAI8818608.1 muts domain V-domain-containing protein [Fimicolochytrium jonesii]